MKFFPLLYSSTLILVPAFHSFRKYICLCIFIFVVITLSKILHLLHLIILCHFYSCPFLRTVSDSFSPFPSMPQYHIVVLGQLFLLLHLLGISLALSTILLPSSKIIINLLNLLFFITIILADCLGSFLILLIFLKFL